MSREKKDGKRINFYMDRKILDMLDQYCEEMGQTKTIATERILQEHLETYFANRESEELEIVR